MMDALGILLALESVKTNTFNSAAYSMAAGGPYPIPVWAKIFYNTVQNTSGNAVVSFTADWSNDGTTWTTAGLANQVGQAETILTTSTTAQYGVAWIPIVSTKPFYRVNINFSSTTGAPTGKFGIYLVNWGEGPRASG
jgi:hypothetical protein